MRKTLERVIGRKWGYSFILKLSKHRRYRVRHAEVACSLPNRSVSTPMSSFNLLPGRIQAENVVNKLVSKLKERKKEII